MKQVLIPLATIQKMASYMAGVQPALEKAAELEAQIAKLAPEAVDKLVASGILSPRLKEAKARLYIEKPASVFADLGLLTGHVRAQAAGAPSGERAESAGDESADATFERILMGGQAS